MSYDDVLRHLFALRRFGIKPGLERVLLLLDKLGSPQTRFPAIHVVGTNGKGSTASFLSSILSAASLKAGLFTSPHLLRFTERIRICGEEIKEDEVTVLATRVLDAAPEGAT